jgi:hypothetical protein
LAADDSYGTGPFLSWLVKRGVEPHVPVLERAARPFLSGRPRSRRKTAEKMSLPETGGSKLHRQLVRKAGRQPKQGGRQAAAEEARDDGLVLCRAPPEGQAGASASRRSRTALTCR